MAQWVWRVMEGLFFFVLFFLVGHATWLPHRMFSFRTSLLCFEKFHYLYHETCLYRCQTKNTDGRKKKQKTWYNGSVSTAGARSSRRSPNVRYVGLPKYRASWRKLLEKRMTCRIGLVDLFFFKCLISDTWYCMSFLVWEYLCPWCNCWWIMHVYVFFVVPLLNRQLLCLNTRLRITIKIWRFYRNVITTTFLLL